jgi:diadenosine tetraphosphate (Ap4A) HIT family hydrolase
MASDYCRFCDATSDTYKWLLEETDGFRIVGDDHPLTEGHILIVPKKHVSCIGAYSEPLLDEFTEVFEKSSKFVRDTYGSVSSFEHGIFGQTINHSHIHLLPFQGTPNAIVLEGDNYLRQLNAFRELHEELELHNGYLLFTLGNEKWLADTSLSLPRFFRERFARALNRPEIADWKAVQSDAEKMSRFAEENKSTIEKWSTYNGV